MRFQPLDRLGDLVETKLRAVASGARVEGTKLEIDPNIIQRIVALSGGHPHLIQLLGSHLVERENQDPDGLIGRSRAAKHGGR